MTDDDMARIDKQFDSLEEALLDGFERLERRIEQQIADLREMRAGFDETAR